MRCEDWQEVRLGEVGEIVGGATPSTKQEDYYTGDIPWITPKDLSGYNSRFIGRGERSISESALRSCSSKLIPANSILFSSRAPIGYMAISQNTLCTNQGFKSIVPNADNYYMFIFYLLRYNKDNIEAMGSGSTFKEVSGNVMKGIRVCVPPLPEQKAIAAVLSALDDKIELNNRINKTLEEMAQAIFKSWFVDFEPFQDGEFVESELGLIPKGWRVGTLGDYCKVKSGFAFKSQWWTDSGIKVIKIKNIGDDLNLSDCSYVSVDKVESAKDFVVVGGDVLIAMTGATIGKFSTIPYTKETLLVNQRVGKFFLGKNPIEKLPFLYCNLKTKSVIDSIINKGQGSAQPNISPTDIESTQIILPDEMKIDMLNRLLLSVFEQSLINLQQSKTLAALRDTLLPKLMSGEIRVPLEV